MIDPKHGVCQPRTSPDALQETAARWHERLQREPVPERIRAAFSRWFERAPEHRAAYEATDHAWRTARSVAHDPRILELRHETALRLTRRSSRRSRRMGWAAAAVVLAFLGGVIFFANREGFGSRIAGVYRTGIGERLSVTLNDGSRVTLNTDSVLRPAFDTRERRVVLERGQALFEVAKDPVHPFVVETPQRRFIAVGTAFDVRIDGARVQVTMLEGTVRVERNSAGKGAGSPAAAAAAANASRPAVGQGVEKTAVATITAGEQLTVLDDRQDRVQVTEPDQVTSWRRGQVIFEDSRLIDAVAEINRYSAVQIELAEPALAEIRISGAFATGRPTVFVEAITAYFPVDASRVGEHTVLLSARKAAASGK
jgi:transmembrane sensor